MKIFLTAIFGFFFLINSFGQVPQLVKNINPKTADANSHSDPAKNNYPNNTYPDTGLTVNGGIVFPAYNFNGTELWKSNGTSTGTKLVKDLESYGNNSSYPQFLTKLGNYIYFFTAGYDYEHNVYNSFHIARVDTTTGLIDYGNLNYYRFDVVKNVVAADGKIFFIGYNSNTSYLVTSDTSLISYDPNNNSFNIITSNKPRELFVFGNKILFSGYSATHGREPWVYDIENDNAYQPLDINQNPGQSSNPHDFINLNNQIFYTADAGDGFGMQIKTIDSSLSSFSGVILPQNNANPKNKTVFNNNIYFRLYDSSTSAYDVWRYAPNNDSAAFIQTDVDSTDGKMAVANGHLFFAANDGNSGNDLWSLDSLENLQNVTNNGGVPQNLVPLGNKLLFVADKYTGTGPQLWQTNGDTANIIKNIQPNDWNGPPRIFATDNNGYAYLFADDGVHGRELWKTDGTNANTLLVKDINLGDNNSIGSNITGMDSLHGNLYFGASDGTTNGLYKSDSVGNNVTLVANNFDNYYYSPDQIKTVGNTLFFVASAHTLGGRGATTGLPDVGFELWKTDGTQAGTVFVKDINPGQNGSNANQFTSCNGKLFFVADDGTHGTELWISDGTTAGTILVKDIVAGVGSPSIHDINVLGNKIYFLANDSTHGEELWVSDGTTVGTFILKDIYPGTNSSNIGSLRAIDSSLYFSANNNVNGNELWKSDGTSAGTNLFKDINPGSGSSNPGDFTKLGSYIYFGADSLGNQNTLWRTDGTVVGTHFFNAVGFPFMLTNIGNKITFICDPVTSTTGFEMWATDGTSTGTSKLTNFSAEGVGLFYFQDLKAYKNHGFYWLDDNVHGMELWQTDGTPSGTFVNDIAPGPPSSAPFVSKGAGPYFVAANDGSNIGYELFKINVSSTASLVSFTATKLDTARALLHWQTSLESGNLGFVVQHSVNNTTWDSLGFVPAASNASNGASYNFTDSISLHQGFNYYRLKQRGNDGGITYSNTELINIYAPLKGGIIKKSDTLCPAIVPTNITDSVLVTGGYSGTYTYQWQDSLVAGNWHTIPGATSSNYNFTSATNITTYYRRKVFDFGDTAFSNVISKIYKTVGDTSIAPTNNWNVYVYGGLDATLANAVTSPYYGFYQTGTAVAFNSYNEWNDFTNPTTAATYAGCPLLPYNLFTINAKRKGFSNGNYVVNISYQTANTKVYLDHVLYGTSTQSNFNVSLGALNPNSIIEVRLPYQPYYYGVPDNQLIFNLFQSELKGGSIISYNQNVCIGSSLNFFSNGFAYGGPSPLTYTYQWQDSSSAHNWQDIQGATQATSYSIAAGISIPTSYRRKVSDGITTAYSNALLHTISIPNITPVISNVGRVLSMPYVSGIYGYKWFRNGTEISGATSNTYTATLAGTYTGKYPQYCGDGPASNAIVFAADALNQTINFPAPPTQPYSNNLFVKLNATAASGLPIQYTLLSGIGYISHDTLFVTGASAFTIQANQAGNNTYTPAASVNASFTVSQASQTISFPAISGKKYSDGSFALNATSTSGLAASFSIVSGNGFVSGNSVVITGAGPIVVQASQGGNGNYNAAPNVQQTICVGVSTLGNIVGDTATCPVVKKYFAQHIDSAIYDWTLSGGGTMVTNKDTATVTWQNAGQYTVSVKAYSSCDLVRSIASTENINVFTVVVPGAVSNMLPVNGIQNQNLPLLLSWIPGSNTDYYDLFVWDSSTAIPTTPYAAHLNSVNYTLPNSGFIFNKTYKWMLISHNLCSQINGPIQTFRLIPLPDLKVLNVQSPATAFSGQPISISWQVTNIGPGRTNLNQNWGDAVFLSFDSMPHFSSITVNPGAWNSLDLPVRPLLLGVVPNVTALDSGQSYTSSLTFTTPVNYSWPLYTYVITNYAPGASSPQEMTLANDTAHKASPTIVTLSPAPDLRVDSVLTPSTTFSGSAITVSYKVKNYGATTLPNNSWVDKIYISKDPFFDVNTATLLNQPKTNNTFYYNPTDASFTNITQLQKDSFYRKNVQVVVPNYIQGSFYIYVFTDVNNSVYEASNESNNTGRNLMQVLLTPTPMLTVSSLTVPITNVSTTQPIGINWNIKNNGFYENIRQNQGHYMAITQQCATCYIPYCPPPPPCPNGNCGSYVCPLPQPGFRAKDSTSWGSSNWKDYVYLSTDSSGLHLNNAIFIGQYLHGNASDQNDYDFLTTPNSYLGGVGFPSYINPRDYDINAFNVIRPSSNFASPYNFTVPDLPSGNYYVYVYANADSAVYQYPSQFQYRRSDLPLIVSRPDVVLVSVTAPNTTQGGQGITVNYSLQNNGPGNVFAHARNDYFYVSNSPTFDGSATLISTVNYYEALPINTPVNHSFNFTFPINASGAKYFYVFTNKDSTLKETNYANNINNNGILINVAAAPTPDLYASNISIPNTVFTSLGFPIKYTVPNQGAAATYGSWTDSLFISCSPIFNYNSANFIGLRNQSGSIVPGGSYTDSFSISLPFTFDINGCLGLDSATAYFFVKPNASNALYEGANGNNAALGTGAKLVINPYVDQIVTRVIAPDTAIVGRPYATTWSVKNIGKNPNNGYYYYQWNDGMFFSTDSTFNNNVTKAGNDFGNNKTLNNNQTDTLTKPDFLVPNISTGDYYVQMKTDVYSQIRGEKMRSNNTNLIRNANGSAKKIHVVAPLLPDFVDSIITAPTTVAVGQPLNVKYKIKNQGVGLPFPNYWSDYVWLSTDFIPGNAGDILLSGKLHNGDLQPGQFYVDSISAIISPNQPPGNYVLIVQTNPAQYPYETNASNNASYQYITVYIPAATDLIVQNISHPDTAFLGYPDTTIYLHKNISINNATGFQTDGIYLSKLNTLDTTAILLGTKYGNINLLPLATDTIKVSPLLQGITEGNYNVLVKTDVLNNIIETNKDNNVGVALKQLYVKVKPLPLNVLTPNNLSSNNVYYKLTIPDSLNGSTILITLKSNDSLIVNNQMYVGQGFIPSASHFDYAFGTPNSGNQQILIPSIISGDNYITIKCSSPPNVPQNITLLAQRLPFAIVNVVSNQGGNTGNVTVKITGSLFNNNMVAKLHKTGSPDIVANAIYFTNSTVVYATFPLQGAALGQYDLILTKAADSSTAALLQSFAVVPANNGGIINGGGINTGQIGSGSDPGCDPGATSGLNSQLQTAIVTPANALAGFPFSFKINYSNPTNIDIPAQTRVLYSLSGLKLAFNQADLATAGTTLYVSFVVANGPPNIIPAGASGVITIYALAPSSYPGHSDANFILK